MTREKEIGRRYAEVALADDGMVDETHVKELMIQIYNECHKHCLDAQKAYGHFFAEMALWLIPVSER